MTLVLRVASEADEEAVIALWRTCGLVVSHNDPATDFRFARAKENSEVLVGLAPDGKIIGSAMVGHDGHRGWLYYIAIAPGYRAQGLGRIMMQAAEKWLAERGVAKVHLMIRETNTEVAAFYRRLGFEAIPRTVMEKWLRPKPSN
jgi:ribosomal protein S18 acetylase RimI-like enzyme